MYKVDPKYLSNELKEVLSLYNVKGVLPRIVGGYSYINQEFPADVDLIESIHFQCHTKCQDYSIIFRNIIEKIHSKREVFLADFKAGFDPVLIQLKDPTTSVIKSLRKQGFIDTSQNNQLLKLRGKARSEYARLIYTIRWNYREIMQGEKVLSGGRKIRLNTALIDGSMVKIDLIAPIDGFLREITNVFFIYQDEKLLYDITSTYLQRVDQDMEKYASKMFKDSMKYTKRLWSKSFALNDTAMLARIAPHFHSSAAKLYQMKAEAETIIRLLTTQNDVSCIHDKIIDQIDGFKTRIGHLNDLETKNSRNLGQSMRYIDRIYEKCKHGGNHRNYEVIVKNLSSFIEKIKPFIEEESSKFLKKIKI